MILCQFCNFNIADDGGTHICFPLVNKIKQIKDKYSYVHRIMGQFLKSGSTKNVDLYYDSIFRYSTQDYQITNPFLRLDSKSKFSDYLKNRFYDLNILECIEACKDLPVEDVINQIITYEFPDVYGVNKTKTIISDLFNFPTFSDQNYLLRGLTLPDDPDFKKYQTAFNYFTNGDIKNSLITEKAFTSTSTKTPLDNKLLTIIFLDPIFGNHEAKNIKSSTKFMNEDEVVFFPDSRFIVSYFSDIEFFPSHVLFKISPNLGKKFKYVAVLIALPLYYNKDNFKETQFIKNASEYWSFFVSEKALYLHRLQQRKKIK